MIRKSLVENKNDLEIQRKDPNCPLYSVKSFEELNLQPNLLKGVYAMGFNAPSKIQETALPTLLADPPQNMIAQSQSGTEMKTELGLKNNSLKGFFVVCYGCDKI